MGLFVVDPETMGEEDGFVCVGFIYGGFVLGGFACVSSCDGFVCVCGAFLYQGGGGGGGVVC